MGQVKDRDFESKRKRNRRTGRFEEMPGSGQPSAAPAHHIDLIRADRTAGGNPSESSKRTDDLEVGDAIRIRNDWETIVWRSQMNGGAVTVTVEGGDGRQRTTHLSAADGLSWQVKASG